MLHHHDSIHDNALDYDLLVSEYVKSILFNFNNNTLTIQYNDLVEYNKNDKCFTSFEIDNSYRRFVFILYDKSGEIVLILPIYNCFVTWQSKDSKIIKYKFEYSKIWFLESVKSDKKIMKLINEHNNENKKSNV